MRRTAFTLLATLALLVSMAMSTVVASAGWTWEDCPPASSNGVLNRSDRASEIVKDVEPPSNYHSLPPYDSEGNPQPSNPGNKFKID